MAMMRPQFKRIGSLCIVVEFDEETERVHLFVNGEESTMTGPMCGYAKHWLKMEACSTFDEIGDALNSARVDASKTKKGN